MTKEDYFIGINRGVALTILSLSLVLPSVILSLQLEIDEEMNLLFTLLVATIPFIHFINTLILSCKEYSYSGYEILVYSGYFKHYIKVNGEKFDELNAFSFKLIILSCSLPNDDYLEATISSLNRISLKINNKLYKNK